MPIFTDHLPIIYRSFLKSFFKVPSNLYIYLPIFTDLPIVNKKDIKYILICLLVI